MKRMFLILLLIFSLGLSACSPGKTDQVEDDNLQIEDQVEDEDLDTEDQTEEEEEYKPYGG